MIYLCIAVMMAVTSVISNQKVDIRHLRVFPAINQSIAGVFQVSHLNDHNQLQYAFNASEARTVCSALGVNIASKAEVNQALARGLETCRYGWVDENIAVIPRINTLSNCGNNHAGVVLWRAPVTKVFDVFCFNESDAAIQLKHSPTEIPLSLTEYSGETRSPSEATVSSQTTHSTPSSYLHPSFSSAQGSTDMEAEPARFVGTAQGSAQVKIILIASTCASVLAALIIIVYLKLQRSCLQSADVEKQKEYIETEEWECVTKKDSQEDEKIKVEVDAS